MILEQLLHVMWYRQPLQGEDGMSPRQAVRILMLSPIYFRLRPLVRWRLVCEYCQKMNALAG